MRSIRFIFAGLISFVFSSCVFEISDGSEVGDPYKEVVFASVPSTKGSVLADDSHESMGVFAYTTQTGLFSVTNVSETAMANQKMHRTKELDDIFGEWSYSPVRFWPASESEKMSFFAYAPFHTAANGIMVDRKADSPVPVLHYKVPMRVEDQPDLCVAIPQINKTYRDEQVTFDFKRVLSYISFFIEGAGAKVAAVSVTGIKTAGSLSLGLESEGRIGAPYDYMIRWNLEDEISELNFSAGLQFDEGENYLTTTAESKNILREDGFLMMLPQTLTSKATIIMTLSDGSKKEFPLRMMSERWQPGMKYQYKFKWRGGNN